MLSGWITLAKAVSRLLGWTYTFLWSISFYPQPLLNIQRRSTEGSSIDFPFINLLGFLCYLISTSMLLWSPTIRSQYAARNPISPEPTVRGNDVAFAAHAALLSGITLSMFWRSIWGFHSRSKKPSRPILGIAIGCVVGVGWVASRAVMDGGNDPARWAWIDIVYAFGYAKLFITAMKYIPQIRTNYQRQSTVGWSIWQVLYDMGGGLLSIAQLLIDSSLQADWSGFTGNPVKFGLGNMSLLYGCIFVLQHYCLYSTHRERDSAEALLLPSQEQDRLV